MRRYFNEWLFLVVFWILLSLMLTGVMLASMQFVVDLFKLDTRIENDPLLGYSFSDFQYLESLLFGFFFGSFFFLMHRMTESHALSKKSQITIILLKTVYYLLSVGVVAFLVGFVIIFLGFAPKGYLEFGIEMVELIKPTYIIIPFIFILFGVLLSNFLLQVNQKYGEGKIWPVFFGKYHKPREERRIFMFIDLKSSTTYAEQLGHIKYSQLIQECFHELNHLAYQYKAEIYQYVGDEIVLTWYESDGFKDLNCVKIFFAFEKLIRSKQDYFMKRYDLVPDFKVGLNGGDITVAEVGIYKRDIAYHGDTINTASRIMDLCNQYGKDFLTSEEMVNRIDSQNVFNKNYLGEVSLKGKKNPVKIYSIELKEDHSP